MENINFFYLTFFSLILIFFVLLALLYFSFNSNRVRLLNGMLFTLLGIIGIGIGSLGVTILNIKFLEYIWFGLLIIGATTLVIFQSILGLLLLWNAFILWRKESHSLNNLLTLLLGGYIVLSPFLLKLLHAYLPSWIAEGVQNLSISLAGYFVFWMVCFMTSFFLYRVMKPKFNQEFIIVLGAGLINGSTITPLLKSRIDVAIKFANKQFVKIEKKPFLIMSGGQGKDEEIPESKAMKQYAIDQGYPNRLIITEDKSQSTYENMLYSKKIITELKIDAKNGIFSTSDYHVFRGAGFARMVGLPINGIGAPTKKYFLYNAFIREYIAILARHKKFHVFCICILIVLTLLISILNGYLTNWL